MSEHISVLLDEAIDALNIRPDGVYVDGTFGRGGHSRAILAKLNDNGRLIVFDKDPQAIATANELAAQDKRVSVIHSGFQDFQAALNRLEIKEIDGALFDLGLSSPQLDNADRGFSFRYDAPLDMRMNNATGQTAAEWLNTADEQEIAQVIRDYGEEKFYKRIAAMIVARRPVRTTVDLANICRAAITKHEKGQHPATRTFQGVRIFINGELTELSAVLPQVVGCLKTGGRLAVIAFHSLEDRIVKQFIKQQSTVKPLPKWVMTQDKELEKPPLKIVGKAIRPLDAEVQNNPRARSAVLRVAERTDGKL